MRLDDRRTATGGAPLRIALNATGAVSGGGATYWLNMLPALAALGSPHEFHLLVSRSQNRLDGVIPPGFQVTRVTFPRPRAVSRLLWDQTALPAFLLRHRIDVLHAPADMAPFLSPCPFVLAIRNVNSWWGPPLSSFGARTRVRVVRALTKSAARRAAHVFFVSETSRGRIVPVIGVPLSKTSVVYHGIGERFFSDPGAPAAAGSGTSGAYVLSVSAVSNHKGYDTLLRAFSKLDGVRSENLRLLIAGAIIDPPYRTFLGELAAELRIDKQVEFLGEVPYHDLPGLYRNASLFVMPTLAETFGHPMVEAMASGVAVIVSDLDITREICGEAACYFPAEDSSALAAVMEHVLGDEGLRSERISAGRQRASAFSWKRTARLTLDLLEGCAGGARRQTATDRGEPTNDSSTV